MVPVRMAPHHHNLDLISVHAAAGSKVNGALDADKKRKNSIVLAISNSGLRAHQMEAPCLFPPVSSTFPLSLSLSLSIAARFFEQELSSLEGSTRRP